jgi:hypothetical protein
MYQDYLTTTGKPKTGDRDHFFVLILLNNITRATLWQDTPVTKGFDRDVGIIDMHIGDMLWEISRKYLVHICLGMILSN